MNEMVTLSLPPEVAAEQERQARIESEAAASRLVRLQPGLTGPEDKMLGPLGPLKGYILGFKRYRVAFGPYDGDDEAIVLCGSEDSEVPVPVPIATANGFRKLQPGPCVSCPAQDWAVAKRRGLKSPPCSLGLNLLLACDGAMGRFLGVLRGRRTGYQQTAQIVRQVRMRSASIGSMAWMYVPILIGTAVESFGKKEYGVWTYSAEAPQPDPFWAEFDPAVLNQALVGFHRPIWGIEPEPEPEPESSVDDDIPF